MTRWMLALLVLGLGLPGPAPAKEKAHSATTVLVMPFELVDTSLQGELEGSKRDLGWVHHLTGYVEGLLRDSGRYRILDRKPVAGLINTFQDDYRYVYRCRTCAVKAAREAGADLVVVGWVQKVSNLIRNLTIRVQDGKTGKVVAGGWTSLRGNTPVMLRRAARQVVTTHILKPAGNAAGP